MRGHPFRALSVKVMWSVEVHPPKLYLCIVQVPMYSASGLRVQYLKVWEKSGYKVDKWVRKVCKSGDYMIRT